MKPISSMWAESITFNGARADLPRPLEVAAFLTASTLPSASTLTSSARPFNCSRTIRRTSPSSPETAQALHSRSNSFNEAVPLIGISIIPDNLVHEVWRQAADELSQQPAQAL